MSYLENTQNTIQLQKHIPGTHYTTINIFLAFIQYWT